MNKYLSYYNYEKLECMAKWIQSRVNFKPIVGIICGSGLGEIADLVEDKVILLMIITNAAGGINPSYKVGDLMVLKDHISFPVLSLTCLQM